MQDHQNLQGADVWWNEAQNKFERLWSRDHKKLRVKLKTNISSSTRSIPPELAGRWLMVTASHPWSHMTFWLCSLARSHEKFKTQYLLFHKTYGHQVWLVKGPYPENQMIIDHLSFVMLNLYEIDSAIDKHDANFII